MPSLKGIAKVIGPRLVAVAAGWLSAELAKRFGAVVEPESLTAIMIGTYAGVHKAISAKVNPGDAATGRVADGINAAANDPSVDAVVRIPDHGEAGQ